MIFWSNHGHFEHQNGKVAFRIFWSGLGMLLCIMIPIEIANNPGHLLQSGSVAADPPAFMGNRGCGGTLLFLLE